MQLPAILAATLGLSKSWNISKVVLSRDLRRLDITVDYVPDEGCICPVCGISTAVAEVESCIWFQKDFLNYETYLYARVPSGVCLKTKAQITPPWDKNGSKFSVVTSNLQQ